MAVRDDKTKREKNEGKKEKEETLKDPLTEEEKRELLLKSEISLLLDTYDDLFSDFDPRPYSQRAISEDFLAEALRATREKATEQIELKFLIPLSGKNGRSISTEHIIRKRLKEYFKKREEYATKEVNAMIQQGTYFIIIGLIGMAAATLMLVKKAETSYIASFLVILLEPAGWFFFWEGLHIILFESKHLKPKVEFNRKMSKADIKFIPY